jgi:hypothetical protein
MVFQGGHFACGIRAPPATDPVKASQPCRSRLTLTLRETQLRFDGVDAPCPCCVFTPLLTQSRREPAVQIPRSPEKAMQRTMPKVRCR